MGSRRRLFDGPPLVALLVGLTLWGAWAVAVRAEPRPAADATETASGEAPGSAGGSSVPAASTAGPSGEEEAQPPVDSDDSQPARPRAMSGPTPLALTVSGGVSLGSYEAGFLFYVTEWLKRNPSRARLHVATGASAGSTNALYALLSACSENVLDPRQSLFWTWVQLGLDDLFDPEKTTGVNLLSPEGAEPAFEAIEQRLSLGLKESCDVLYGATVTRLTPSHVVLADESLRLPNLEERFTLRIRGRGIARRPRVSDYPAVASGAEHTQLYIDPAQPVDALRELLTASSAFPVAFPPAKVRYCRHTPGAASQECEGANVESADFIDGGVFDNTPVSLALRLMERGLSSDGTTARVRDQADPEARELPPGARFLVVAPGLAADALREQEEYEAPTSVLPLAFQFLGTFIATARSRELTRLFESAPDMRKRVLVARESLPPMSGHMGAFLGFFEEEFRRFDFVLGMYEAHRFLAQRADTDLAGTREPMVWPEPPEAEARQDVIYQPLLCLRGTLAKQGGPVPACEGPGLRDFRIALQVSIEVLHERCKAGLVGGNGDALCAAVQDGEVPRQVTGLPPEPGCERGANEGETVYVLRRLAEYGFEFRDLGLRRSQASQAPDRIRAQLEDIIAALARAQRHDGLGQALGVRAMGRAAANIVAYRSPRYTAHAAFGSLSEIGGTGLLPARGYRGLRWAVSGQFMGLQSVFSSRRRTFGFATVLGLEFETVRLSGPVLQLRFGGAGGYAFLRQDGDGRTRCGSDVAPDEGDACSRPLTQAYVTLTVLELLRLSLHTTVFPKLRGRGDPRYYSIFPNLGIQLTF